LEEFSISISLCKQENVTKAHLLLTISAASVNKAYRENGDKDVFLRGRNLRLGQDKRQPGYHHAHIPPRKSGNVAPGFPPPGLGPHIVT